MQPFPLNVLYWGAQKSLPEQHALQAGALSAVLDESQILNIRWRGQEVLRRIYAAVRDSQWGTVPARVSNLAIRRNASSFLVTFDVLHEQDEIVFAWKGVVEGFASGKLLFSMRGEALSSFLRNRIGFCLLHSAKDCEGKRFHVTRPDGTYIESDFPETIETQQLIPGAEAMAALSYQAQPCLRLTLKFEGDVFQMEDQRNWTDATYKTFCTPLELPCPADIKKGDVVSQKVVLSLEESGPFAFISSREDSIVVDVGSTLGLPMPAIGFGVASHVGPLTRKEASQLRRLRPSHLRVDLRLHDDDWTSALFRANVDTQSLGCSLEVAIFVSDDAERELLALREVVTRGKMAIRRWLIFHQVELATSERWITLARSILFPCAPAQFASGTNGGFCELTNFRPPPEGLDAVSFSIHPQEHATDNTSLIETLPIQKTVIENARSRYGLPVLVSPVTLKPRFNLYGPEKPPAPAELPGQVDVRQMSLFGAAWTLGSLKYASEAGANALTYYETTGWRGLVESEMGAPLPQFHSFPGLTFPLYHIFADYAALGSAHLVLAQSTNPLEVDALAFGVEGRIRVLAGNMTAETRLVRFRGMPSEVHLSRLDEEHALEAMTNPRSFAARQPDLIRTSTDGLVLRIRPYSIVRLDA